MIVYLDTSAVIPLLITESSSTRCARIWNDAQTLVSTRLLYVETMAALSQGEMTGRLSAAQFRDRASAWTDMWDQLEIREFDKDLMVQSGMAAQRYGLRGYDSVHSAAAASLAHPQLVAASGDRKLLASWREQGLATIDTNTP